MRIAGLLLLVSILLAMPVRGADDPSLAERMAMVGDIKRSAVRTERMTGIGEIDPRVLTAFAIVPRHIFVPPQLVPHAYADTPLPLGFGQNLTQPFVAALMTHLLGINPGDRVFETGTDTGYHAAILMELGARVFSVEIVAPLPAVAKRLVEIQGYGRITLRLGDGYYGWAEHAPYDAMLIKESSASVPAALLRQLKPGGRMVIPLGPPDGPQYLTLVRKDREGNIEQDAILPVGFAPFQGGDRI